MRPVDDLALRARNWFWYWMLRNSSGHSNDRLDALFLDPGASGGRRRHFERIELTASSPDSFALKDGKTLLALVEEGGFPDAGQVFASKLWDFLSARDAPVQLYSDFIAEYVKAKEWHRLHVHDIHLYITFLGEEEPAVQPDVSTAYSAMLHKLANEATFESLAVLIALFREAMSGMLLKQAIAIQTAITSAVTWTCMRNGIPELPRALLDRLVKDRVLGNRWFTEADWRHHSDTPRKKVSTRERVREFQAWIHWYVKESRNIGKTPYGHSPIVPRSERIDWLEAHRTELAAVKTRVGQLKEEHWRFEDSPFDEFREYAEQALAEANALLKKYVAPESEPTQFYVSRPNFEMGNLPDAF